MAYTDQTTERAPAEVYLIGGGIASRAAAVFMIRDCDITVPDELDKGTVGNYHFIRCEALSPPRHGSRRRTIHALRCWQRKRREYRPFGRHAEVGQPYAKWSGNSRTGRKIRESLDGSGTLESRYSNNLALMRQFRELPDDAVFIVVYSVRQARVAAHRLLNLKWEPIAVYRGMFDPRVPFRSFMALHDIRS